MVIDYSKFHELEKELIIEEEQEKVEERLQHRIDYHKRQEQKVEKWKRKQRDLGKSEEEIETMRKKLYKQAMEGGCSHKHGHGGLGHSHGGHGHSHGKPKKKKKKKKKHDHKGHGHGDGHKHDDHNGHGHGDHVDHGHGHGSDHGHWDWEDEDSHTHDHSGNAHADHEHGDSHKHDHSDHAHGEDSHKHEHSDHAHGDHGHASHHEHEHGDGHTHDHSGHAHQHEDDHIGHNHGNHDHGDSHKHDHSGHNHGDHQSSSDSEDSDSDEESEDVPNSAGYMGCGFATPEQIKAAQKEAAKRPPLEIRNKKKRAAIFAAREDGNVHFRKGQYELAFQIYDRALLIIADMYGNDDADEMEQLEGKIALNMAACALKLKRWKQALDQCELAKQSFGKEVAKKNPKIPYRIAEAYIGLQQYEKAKDSLEKHREIVTDKAGSYISMKERLDKLIAEEDAATKKSEEEFARRFREKARKKKKKLRAKTNSAGESSV